MGVFSGNQSFGSSNDITMNESFETLLESNTEPCETDDFEEESLNAITTMTENYNMIMTAIGITEAVAVEKTGKEFVWTEGVLSDFGNKIKSFFKKIWEKIKGLFKRAIAMFDSYQMKDKAFVKKYRKEIFSGKDLSDFTFKGWDFKNLDNTSAINAAIGKCGGNSLESIQKIGKDNGGGYAGYNRTNSSNYDTSQYARDDSGNSANDREKLANKQMEKIEDKVEALRGLVLGELGINSKTATADEFRNEIKEWIHGDSTEKEDLDNISVNNLADYLVGSKTTTKNLNNLFKENKRKIDQDIKFVEGLQKEDWRGKPTSGSAEQKDTAAARAVDLSYALRLVRESKEMLITLDGLLIAGYKERSRQYKACLVKIMHYNPKSESYNESYSGNDYSYSGNNFLAGVELK